MIFFRIIIPVTMQATMHATMQVAMQDAWGWVYLFLQKKEKTEKGGINWLGYIFFKSIQLFEISSTRVGKWPCKKRISRSILYYDA
jgi:hypothetical protein